MVIDAAALEEILDSCSDLLTEGQEEALKAAIAAAQSAVPSVPEGKVLVNRKDAELAGRFAFNNAGKGLRAGVASAGERLMIASRGTQ